MMEAQRNLTSDTDSMLLVLSGRAPICTRFPSQDHYEDAGFTTRLTPPSPQSPLILQFH